jgi:tetratricopeptide (TPR) repeat protein
MDPSWARAHWILGMMLVQKKEYDPAIAELRKAVELAGGAVQKGSLGYALAVAGRRAEALEVVEQLEERSKRTYTPPSAIALVYAGLGEKDQAVSWLEKASVERDPWATSLRTEPMFDSLQSDPRFKDLRHRLKLD